jgi:hypothetical protein
VVLSSGESFEKLKPNYGGNEEAHTFYRIQIFVEVLARSHWRVEVGDFVMLRP